MPEAEIISHGARYSKHPHNDSDWDKKHYGEIAVIEDSDEIGRYEFEGVNPGNVYGSAYWIELTPVDSSSPELETNSYAIWIEDDQRVSGQLEEVVSRGLSPEADISAEQDSLASAASD